MRVTPKRECAGKLRGPGRWFGQFMCGCWVSASALLIASVTLAQSEAGIEPPELISLPEISVPTELALPDGGRVAVVIVVSNDGTATLGECTVDPAVCELVAGAIGGARFKPAQRDGVAISARVRMALRLAAMPPPAAGEETSTDTSPPPASPLKPQPSTTPPTSVASTASGDVYGARARVHAVQAGSRRLELAEMRDLPGAFGDPFRAVDSLPGVVPVLSGLPYFFIRGSPPAGTLYIYDDIPVPTLYHLAIGPAVIHPRMVGPVTLYSGVAPARYGRLTGGVIVGEGPEAGDGRTHVESELRLLDVSAYAQTDVLGGTLTGAVRYGYPALLLSIFSPDVSLAYWDYQLRYATDLSPHDRLELVTLGSYDSIGVKDRPNAAITITFHRIEPRLIHRVGRDEFGAALLFGWDKSALGPTFQLQSTRVGPRLWFEHRFGERNRLRLSADMQGILGNFSTVAAADMNRDIMDAGLVGDVSVRSLWGVQGELTVRPWSALELQFGARADAWVQSGGAQAVLDPRLRVILHASDTFDLHIAGGVVHQPAVFFLPLPGIADLATDRGLQTALQSEVGLGWDTPLGVRAELQLFLHRYSNLVFTDTVFLMGALDTLCGDARDPGRIDCHGASVPKRIDGLSYGGELFLRRAITERLSGFLSYTLALSDVDKVAGLPYTPSWDVRHVANLVLQWQLGAGFSAGLRWFIRSGKTNGEFIPNDQLQLARDEHRLPWFTRLDLQVAYGWATHWGKLRVALEWFNVSASREPEGITCSGLPRTCQVDYLPAIFFPNLSVRGEH